MRSGVKGSVTIVLALSMFGFLMLCLVLVEGTRVYYVRTKTMQALELAEFSILSEYQKELFDQYGVFFLDLDYEQGKEQRAVLEQRAEKYLSSNAEEVHTKSLRASSFRRATDDGGSVFFTQAVELMKVKSGYKFLEDAFQNLENVTVDNVNLENLLSASESKAWKILSELNEAAGDTKLDISIPHISFPSVGVLKAAVLGNDETISEKKIIKSERLEQRNLVKGVGTDEKAELFTMQIFHWYLFENFQFYGSENNNVPKEALEYQLEYIISGKESDQKNLEDILWRIFLLRAGGNYLFFHQDQTHMAAAEAAAAAAAAAAGNPALVSLIRELILIGQAIQEGISETKTVFAGGKVPLYEGGEFSGLKIGYEEYLYLFLMMTGRTVKIYRSMDMIELETRIASGYEKFRMDHCIDCFELEWTYQYDSFFATVLQEEHNVYENVIQRKMYYER